MSKQLPSVFMGFAASRWVQAASSETCAEWIPQNMSFSETIAASRYVDDLALASSTLCTACPGSLTTRINDTSHPYKLKRRSPLNMGCHGYIRNLISC